jgi:hypothetical protein
MIAIPGWFDRQFDFTFPPSSTQLVRPIARHACSSGGDDPRLRS